MTAGKATKPRRFVPDSILGWLLLILVSGVVVSQAISLLLHNISRNQILSEIENRRVAERVVALALFLDHTAPMLRPGIATAMSGVNLEVRIGDRARPQIDADDHSFEMLGQAIASRLDKISWRQMQVGRIIGKTDQVLVAIALADGDWLNFEFPMTRGLPLLSPELVGMTAGGLIAVLGVCLYAVLRLMRPLERLTQAAESLGRSGSVEPMPETGVSEVRRAAHAFNEMQARIGRLIEDRMQMIAAISHDLRTPITRLRLRAELMEEGETQIKILKDLDEMEAMIGSTLSFAREEQNPEPRQNVDLVALIGELTANQPKVRLSVTSNGPWMLNARLLALKRALTNLIDNAVKYGGNAEIRLRRTTDRFEVQIDDAGPGIPEKELTRVFRPFYRLETSRSRETGGTGLGLAIARSAILALGGDIVLKNRNEGGLTALVSLPT